MLETEYVHRRPQHSPQVRRVFIQINRFSGSLIMIGWWRRHLGHACTQMERNAHFDACALSRSSVFAFADGPVSKSDRKQLWIDSWSAGQTYHHLHSQICWWKSPTWNRDTGRLVWLLFCLLPILVALQHPVYTEDFSLARPSVSRCESRKSHPWRRTLYHPRDSRHFSSR